MHFVHFTDEKETQRSQIIYSRPHRKGRALNLGLSNSKSYTYLTTKGLSLEVILEVRALLIRRKEGF